MASSFSDQKSLEFNDAAGYGDLPLVKSLSLDPEVNLNWQDHWGSTPFSNACIEGHVDIVRYLLDFHGNQGGAIDYNLVNQFGGTPFSMACFHGSEQVVEMLVEDQRIDVNRPSESGGTPLHQVSFNGDLGIVEILLASAKQIDTSKKNNEGKTAADVARERGAGFQERKGCQLIASLIDSYENDPQACKTKLRRELGYDEPWAGELFALVVFFSDGYLKIPEIPCDENSKRFFNLASSLPLDLQMVLCNRVFGRGDSIVKKIHSEKGFKKFARV